MDFMEAVKAKCNGKTVMDTDKKYKLEGIGNNIEIYDLEVSEFKKLNKYITQLNWQVVEKKKTLSDKITKHCTHSNPVALECGKGQCSDCDYYVYEAKLKVTDVKEAIKELGSRANEHNEISWGDVREVLGDRLC